MKKTIATLALIATLAATPAMAHDFRGQAAAGGALGGALGAYVGAEMNGRDGAILGGLVGAVAGVAIATDGRGAALAGRNPDHHRDRVVVRERYREPVVYRHVVRETRYYDDDHYWGRPHRFERHEHWDRGHR